jgi:hypothetical protein
VGFGCDDRHQSKAVSGCDGLPFVRADGGPEERHGSPIVVPEGAHDYEPRTLDRAGNSWVGRVIRVQVDTEDPLAMLVQPQAGWTYAAGNRLVEHGTSDGPLGSIAIVTGPLEVIGEASDGTSGIWEVRILLNGQHAQQFEPSASGLYSWTWDAPCSGGPMHVLGIEAEDLAGRVHSRNVTVLRPDCAPET